MKYNGKDGPMPFLVLVSLETCLAARSDVLSGGCCIRNSMAAGCCKCSLELVLLQDPKEVHNKIDELSGLPRSDR